MFYTLKLHRISRTTVKFPTNDKKIARIPYIINKMKNFLL